MNKLTKEQRDKLVAVAIGVVALVAVIYEMGVASKQDEMKRVQGQIADVQKKIGAAQTLLRQTNDITEKLNGLKDTLEAREEQLAPTRETQTWFNDMIKPLKQAHKGVTLDSISKPEESDTGIIPNFRPYSWYTFHITASGRYYDLGSFIADLENRFPYDQIQNPVFTPNTGAAVERWALTARFDLIIPVVTSTDAK